VTGVQTCALPISSDGLDAFFLVQIWIFKQTDPEDICEDTDGRFFHTFAHYRFAITLTADPVCFQDWFFVVVSPKLVYTVHDDPQVAFCHREGFRSEASASENVHVIGGILSDSPVGADDAVVSAGIAEQIPDDVFTVGISHIFMILFVLVPGNGVVRHNGSGLLRRTVQSESAFRERTHMLLETAARIDSKLAERIVSVTSAFSGT